jgi:hypothetical protein
MTSKLQDRRLDSLVLDLLEWLAKEPRTYGQTMDIWRTSCPRLAVWEEAVDRGLVTRAPNPAGGVCITVTAAGRKFLQREGRLVAAAAE